MVREAVALGHPRIYTRPNWSAAFTGVNTVPQLPYNGTERYDDPFHWGSGPYAVLLACTLTDDIHLLGFDLIGDSGKINNVYKGTQNYNDASHRAVDPRYWIAQIGRLLDLYPDKTFTIHQPEGWVLPEAWNRPNVSLDFRSYFV
jgi:hypothetical protein